MAICPPELHKTGAPLLKQDYRKTNCSRSSPIPDDEITSKPSHESNAFPRHLLRVYSQLEIDHTRQAGAVTLALPGPCRGENPHSRTLET